MKTKADYEAYGRRMARAASHELPCMKEGSWQHTAFFKGYQAGQDAKRIVDDPLAVASRQARIKGPYWRDDISKLREVDVPLLYTLAQGLVAPMATREHLKLLGAAHNEEHDLRRRARLHRSLGRVLRRHGRRYSPNLHEPAVPMRSPLQVA